MATLAKKILQRATDILSDSGSKAWTVDEIVRWFNDARRELAIHRPDAFATTAAVALAPGARQTLPATAIKLINIPNNTGGAKTAIRQTERRELDELLPSWRSGTASTTIKHFIHDPRNPLEFEVYPPAAAGASVDAVFAAYPTDIAEPGAGKTFADVTGDIGVPDIYGSVLVDFILYRAYLKDSDFAGHIARASAHYGAFANALGIEVKASLTVAPAAKNPGGASSP